MKSATCTYNEFKMQYLANREIIVRWAIIPGNSSNHDGDQSPPNQMQKLYQKAELPYPLMRVKDVNLLAADVRVIRVKEPGLTK